jgi:HemY protein
MAKFVLFLILLIPLVAAGNWLLDHPGTLTLDWMGYDIELSILAAAGMLALAALLIFILAMLSWQLVTWPERRRARKKYRTLSKGLRELTHGVTALALGNEALAQKWLKKATAHLPGEPLPQLLTAQLLQRQDNVEGARKELRALMQHEATATLASHQLIEQHVRDKAWQQAITLAETLRAQEPSDRWLALVMIDLYARLNDTAKLLGLTEGWKFKSPLTREERHRYAALAYYLQSKTKDDARAKANDLRHATSYAPDFLPAVIDYSDTLCERDERRSARKLLRNAWAEQPDPLLIEPIIHTLADESPRAQHRFTRAVTKGADTAEAHQLEAALCTELGELEDAETELKAALAREESKPLLKQMAALETKLHGESAANPYLSRAADAPEGMRWICQSCGAADDAWHSHCRQCDTFDSLLRQRPEARITQVE